MSTDTPRPDELEGSNFIRTIIDNDLASGKHAGVVTRFPPEPNGYLHIGHAKSICLNFGLAQDYGGRCHLRFDDTNPTKEEVEYVEAIQRDVRWLGFEWGQHLYYASDYFGRMYEIAVGLVKAGKAYVDSQTEDEIRAGRGTVTEPGTHSPFRERPVEESLSLLDGMRRGDFADGAHVLRAKGDMAHPNMKMRDPLLYRIRNVPHDRTGDAWHIYPLYDYAHCLSDAFEGITHSLCTLEFEVNRALYDGFLELAELPKPRPQQIEFARLNLAYTVMSKRRLLQLVKERHVSGWDDPRMPTLAGLRRRGFTPASIRAFAERIGVAKANSLVDPGLLENALRDDLNPEAPRVMAVLRPLRLVVENWPEDHVEWLDAPLFPHDVPKQGTRAVPFTRVLHIEREDFAEVPPKRWHRLAPGCDVRLRYGYVVTCTGVEKNDHGEIVEVRCRYDADTRSGEGGGKKVKGTVHWVSATHGVDVEVRLFDRLFDLEVPDASPDFLAHTNPRSLEVLRARVEPFVAHAGGEDRFQFERQGYFFVDPYDSTPGAPVFNRIVPLKDSWAKQAEVAAPAPKPKVEAAPTKRRTREEIRAGVDAARFDALVDTHGLSLEIAEVLAGEPRLSALFDDALAHGAAPKTVAGLLASDVRRLGPAAFDGDGLAKLAALVDDGTLTASLAKTVLEAMVAGGGEPADIVRDKGLVQLADPSALAPLVDEVIAANPAKVAEFRGGRGGLMGFFVGQVMRRTNGKANAQVVQRLLEERLG